MKYLTESEWNQVWGTFCGLWPKAGAEATEEEQGSYRRVCSAATVNQCQRAMRLLKDQSPKFPLPATVGAAIRNERQRSEHREDADLYSARRSKFEAEARESQEEWANIRASLAEVPADELEQHKATLLAHDWRLLWAKSLSVTSKMWMAHLFARIFKDRLAATDPPVELIPPRQCAGDKPMSFIAGAMPA